MKNVHPLAMARVAIVAIASAILAGCATPAQTFVESERAMFQAIAGEYLDYAMADLAIADLDRKAAAAVIIIWDEALRAEEKRLELDSPPPYPDRTLIERLMGAPPPTE